VNTRRFSCVLFCPIMILSEFIYGRTNSFSMWRRNILELKLEPSAFSCYTDNFHKGTSITHEHSFQYVSHEWHLDARNNKTERMTFWYRYNTVAGESNVRLGIRDGRHIMRKLALRWFMTGETVDELLILYTFLVYWYREKSISQRNYTYLTGGASAFAAWPVADLREVLNE
jgi:hypothetical protein